MCKATRTCTELGEQPERWSKASPLPPPIWFADELAKFTEVIRIAGRGDVMRSRAQLKQVRGEEMRKWYLDHGQNSGVFRNRRYGVTAKIIAMGQRGSPPSSMLVATYLRDHYRCRYCGLRLFPTEVLRAYELVVGTDTFAATAKNASHGAALVFRATYDHVVPLNCGGQHSLDNLVTSCYSCNFGKGGYTLEQLGLNDPRFQQLVPDTWDGLVSLLPSLRSAQD